MLWDRFAAEVVALELVGRDIHQSVSSTLSDPDSNSATTAGRCRIISASTSWTREGMATDHNLRPTNAHRHTSRLRGADQTAQVRNRNRPAQDGVPGLRLG